MSNPIFLDSVHKKEFKYEEMSYWLVINYEARERRKMIFFIFNFLVKIDTRLR